MIEGSLARRYAKALFDLSAKTGQLDSLVSELELLYENIKNSSDLKSVLHSPAFHLNERKKVLAQIMQKMSLSELGQKFIFLLVEKERLLYLDLILKALHENADRFYKRMRVYVRVPQALNAEQEAKLKAKLSQITQAEVKMEIEIHPEILGGFSIGIEDEVFDGSIRANLDRLKKEMFEQVIH